MKRFKQFLFESLYEETLNPRRQDFGTEDEYLQALRDASKKQRAEAEEMTSAAEKSASTLGKIETGLQAADAVTDAALSAGAVAVPGVGTALNAGVKGIKAGIAGSQGDYGKAALYAADAGIPAVGRLASAATQTGRIAQAAKPALELAKDVGSYVANPVKEIVKTGVQAVTRTQPISNLTGKIAAAGEAIGVGNRASTVVGKTSLSMGNKTLGSSLQSAAKNTLDADNTLEQDKTKTPSTQVASNNTSYGRKRIGEI